MTHIIRNATENDLYLLTSIIRDSFRDVAERFHLTPENCPKHPSNCVPEWIQTALEKGVRYYLAEDNGTPGGCVALEQARPGVGYLERLAVLPQYRRRGIGKALVSYLEEQARALGISRIEIGIIAEQHDLKAWYEHFGFVVTGEKEFEHLPFCVAFMAKEFSDV